VHFTRGRKKHKDISRAVFHSGLQHSARALRGYIGLPVSMLSFRTLRCIVSGNVTQVSRYLDLREEGQIAGPVLDVLIRDVLPCYGYTDLDDMINAIVNKRTRLQDVLAVEKRYEPETLWKSFDSMPWCGTGRQRKDYIWWSTVWLRVNLAQTLMLYNTQHLTPGKATQRILKDKIRIFIDAHVPVIRYLDSLDNPCDSAVDVSRVLSLYSGLGPSYYDIDRQHIRVSQHRVATRDTPLRVIQGAFPDMVWTPLEMVRRLEKGEELIEFLTWDPLNPPESERGAHKLYYACLLLLEQLERAAQDTQDSTVVTSLYFYYLAFVDFFYHVVHVYEQGDDLFLLHSGNTEMNSFWQLVYPYDTRAFTIYDCPDLFHVLVHIPLWGTQTNADFVASKLLQKTLPFSGQPRSLINMVLNNIQKSPGFYHMYQQIFWCMLSNAYPNQTVDQYRFDMKYLLRCYVICWTDQALLCELIGGHTRIKEAKQKQSTLGVDYVKKLRKDFSKTSSIILCAFRMYIVYLYEQNPHYVRILKLCIDLTRMKQQTYHMANLIRNSNVYAQDAFANARKKLARYNKKPDNGKVYRYKKDTCLGIILKPLCQQFESWILEAKRRYEEHLTTLDTLLKQGECHNVIRKRMLYPPTSFTHIFLDETKTFDEQVACAKKEASITLDILDSPKGLTWKENILNFVMRVAPGEWLSAQAISVLTLQRFGGIKTETVAAVVEMIQIYYTDDRCLPKQFETRIEDLNVPDINVLVWYFNCLALLNQVKLVPLDADTVRQIDYAMKYKRYRLFPGQHLDPQVYEVLISLCCRKIKTMMGSKHYGHDKVTYNMDRRIYTCTRSRGHKKRKVWGISDPVVDEDLSDDEEEEAPQQTNQDQRKDFQYIPCDGQQPMIRLNLRGFAMYYNGVRYQHCPRCASFHIFDWSNYSGSHDGSYRCAECREKEQSNQLVFKCAICKGTVQLDHTEKCQLTTTRLLVDPHDKSFDPIGKGHDVFETVYLCDRHYKHATRVNARVEKQYVLKYANQKQNKQMKKKNINKYRF